jgi:hypothetical protein
MTNNEVLALVRVITVFIRCLISGLDESVDHPISL